MTERLVRDFQREAIANQERLLLRFSLSPGRTFSVFAPARPFTAGEIDVMRKAMEIMFKALDTDVAADPASPTALREGGRCDG